jgi:hypothetical protein
MSPNPTIFVVILTAALIISDSMPLLRIEMALERNCYYSSHRIVPLSAVRREPTFI